MKSERLNKSRASKLSPRNWKAGGTRCSNSRVSVFLIMFKTGHALLLPGGRFLSPRNGRGLDAECPRHRPASRPWPWPIRDRVQSATSPQPRRDHGRIQSVTVICPCPQSRPQSVHVRDHVRAANIRIQSTSANYPCPRPVRSRALSMTVSSPYPWQVHDRVASGKWPHFGRIASAQRTIHLQIFSAYVRI